MNRLITVYRTLFNTAKVSRDNMAEGVTLFTAFLVSALILSPFAYPWVREDIFEGASRLCRSSATAGSDLWSSTPLQPANASDCVRLAADWTHSVSLMLVVAAVVTGLAGVQLMCVGGICRFIDRNKREATACMELRTAAGWRDQPNGMTSPSRRQKFEEASCTLFNALLLVAVGCALLPALSELLFMLIRLIELIVGIVFDMGGAYARPLPGDNQSPLQWLTAPLDRLGQQRDGSGGGTIIGCPLNFIQIGADHGYPICEFTGK